MTATHLIVSRREAECIEDALKQFNSKAQKNTITSLLRQLDQLLRGSKPRNDGWAPIRSGWPTGSVVKRQRRSDGFFKKPRGATEKVAKPAKKQLTAQDILDSLS
jgi:hypothetical protein